MLGRLVLTVSICSVIVSSCQLNEQLTVLRCAKGVVDLIDLHNPLLLSINRVEKLCEQFDHFEQCSPSSPCRDSIVGHLLHLRDFVCNSSSFLARLTEERERSVECLLDDSTEHVRLCSLLDEKRSECDRVEAYLDCLLTKSFIQQCPNTTSLHLQLALFITGRHDKVDEEKKCHLERFIPKPVIVIPENGYLCETDSVNCTCPLGTQQWNATSKRCQDVDVCLSAPCSQICQKSSSSSSFVCSCNAKYFTLASDNRTCIRKDQDPLWLFFAHGQSIWNISEDGKHFQLQRAGLQKTAMIDVDVKDHRLYYADIGANSIERVNINGAFDQPVQTFEVDGVEGIAIDWVANNLYSLRRSHVFVQTSDGRFRKTLYRNVFRLPRALALHPLLGLLFATDWSADAFIARARMDGTGFEKIITKSVVWPNALSVDLFAERIYWADAFLDTIECSRLDGTGRRSIIADSSAVPHVFGLSVGDQHLYWTDWTYRGILRANKDGSNVTVLAQTALLPYSLKVFHSSLQPQGKDHPCFLSDCSVDNPCLTAGCAQLCLLTSDTSRGQCACADGFDLDGVICSSNCSDVQLLCGGSDARCVSKRYRCDGIMHCKDQADERDCPPRICLAGQFQCHDNKSCLPVENLCDGSKQCEDGSDETFCSLS